jgi:hypothetical protein
VKIDITQYRRFRHDRAVEFDFVDDDPVVRDADTQVGGPDRVTQPILSCRMQEPPQSPLNRGALSSRSPRILRFPREAELLAIVAISAKLKRVPFELILRGMGRGLNGYLAGLR